MKRFDVLVLGGGAAGCVLASRLSENRDRTVCLVEAGPDYGPYPEGRWPADILDARRLALDSHCWVRNDQDDRSQLRARILGGCSAHNACVVLRGAPSDYDEWGPGWSHAELEPYLNRGERTLQSRRLGDEELAPWYQAFREAAGDDAIVHVVNAVGAVRWNAAFAYLDPSRGRTNLTILADTLVDRVLTKDGVATGALAGGRELAADAVVVAAGSYGSPAVLLRSGIGPADELGRHGIPLVAELPVGEGLTDHVGAGAAWEPTEQLRRETQAFERDRPLLMASVTVRGSCGRSATQRFSQRDSKRCGSWSPAITPAVTRPPSYGRARRSTRPRTSAQRPAVSSIRSGRAHSAPSSTSAVACWASRTSTSSMHRSCRRSRGR
ncbi:MAG: hypothetical protein AUG88_03260 [Actinobacteria bacterium 13_1_20CM_4_68_12]|nr:MAG: hypothetical protein AUG88_03260 [Actinobacteria bacterium 13_1_20CM_4_68_12]